MKLFFPSDIGRFKEIVSGEPTKIDLILVKKVLVEKA